MHAEKKKRETDKNHLPLATTNNNLFNSFKHLDLFNFMKFNQSTSTCIFFLFRLCALKCLFWNCWNHANVYGSLLVPFKLQRGAIFCGIARTNAQPLKSVHANESGFHVWKSTSLNIEKWKISVRITFFDSKVDTESFFRHIIPKRIFKILF